MSKDQPVPLPGTRRSNDESLKNSDDHLSSVDSGENEVAGSGASSTLSDRPLVLSAEAPDFVPSNGVNQGDPFEYQLSHPSPQRNRFIARGTQSPHSDEDDLSTTSPRSHATTPQASPLLGFLPSSSSTGYTLSGLPVVTLAEKILHAPSFSVKSSVPTNVASGDVDNVESCSTLVPKVAYYIPYLQLGYLEITDELIIRICPHDLAGKSCPHDEVYEWNWMDARWEAGGGGCGRLRLCEVSSLPLILSLYLEMWNLPHRCSRVPSFASCCTFSSFRVDNRKVKARARTEDTDTGVTLEPTTSAA